MREENQGTPDLAEPGDNPPLPPGEAPPSLWVAPDTLSADSSHWSAAFLNQAAASTSLCGMPSPSRYILATSHCASATPCSAAAKIQLLASAWSQQTPLPSRYMRP